MNFSVSGPEVRFTIPLFGGIKVTETIVNAWVIMAVITLVCIWLTRGLSVRNPSKKQIVAEKLVTMIYNLVREVMGEKYIRFVPYIGTLFTMSIVSSLSGLLGVRAPTADLSTTLAWALVTFVMVQANNIKHNGILGYLGGFLKPIPVLLPINIVGEIANPISMSFRHFGNIASGIVITGLVYGALAALSAAILSFIPVEFINTIPILQVGLPAILSLYFDLFTSFLQAYIICMLTMVFVSGAE